MLLIRHGQTDAVGRRLVSRLPGIPLNANGRAEAARIRAALACEHLEAVYASPLDRAIETAAPLADDHEVPLRTCRGLIEVDFGEWTGRSFAELDARDDWRRFNAHRSDAVVPGGESAVAVQTRMLACMRGLGQRHRGRTIAAVSHADVIRAALLKYARMSLDDWQQIDIAPASISAVALGPSGADILYINRLAQAPQVRLKPDATDTGPAEKAGRYSL